MRGLIRRWLGVEELAKRVGDDWMFVTVPPAADDGTRDFNALFGKQLARTGLAADVKALTKALDRETGMLRQALGDSVVSFAKQGAEIHALQQAQKTEPPSVIEDPVTCPNGHTGVICIQIIEAVSIAETSVRRAIGGGYLCPACQVTFYSQDGRMWQPKKETEAPPDGPGNRVPPPRGPRLKWDNPRRS